MTVPEIRFERDGEWLVVRVSGPADRQHVLQFIEDIATAARSREASAVLIDMRSLVVAIDDLDRYAFGAALSRAWNAVPVAVVWGKDYVDPKRLGEGVARTRGVNLRVFTDEPIARDWLAKVASRVAPPPP